MPTLSTLLSLNTLGLACAAPLAMPDGQGNPLPVTASPAGPEAVQSAAVTPIPSPPQLLWLLPPASPAVPVRPGRGFFRKETEK